MKKSKRLHRTDHLPTSSCKRSLWTPPRRKIARYKLFIHGRLWRSWISFSRNGHSFGFTKLKVRNRERITILRGNHESRQTTQVFCLVSMYVYISYFLSFFGDLFEFWLTHAAQLWPLFDLICCEIINSRVVVLLINCFPDFAPTMPLICVSWLASWYINHPNKHFKYYKRALIAIFLNNVFVVVLVGVLDFVSAKEQ